MKLERLLAIVIILINRKRVQAKDLADMFEVSVRTIYRDIEAINQAGIPVVTYQGVNGGIGIMDGYKWDKNVLTHDELASIAVALKSVSTTYGQSSTGVILEKIKGLIPKNESEHFEAKTGHVLIDFSPWGSDPAHKEKLEVLREAIRLSRCVSFVYHNSRGEETERAVEPYTLVLKRQRWYLYAFCTFRGGFRFFKVSRMRDVKVLDKTYHRQNVEPEQLPWEKEWYNPKNTVELVLKCQQEIRPLVEEWFGIENVHTDDGGYSIARAKLPEDDWLYGFILSFGAKAEVLAPEHIRDIIREMAAEVHNLYRLET